MSGADRFVSMSLDEVIKHRRHEGGRGGFRRGGRGARGAMMQQRGGPRGAIRGQRGGGFPQRSPGGRIAKNRVQHQQGLHQNMQGMQPMMRGPRGGGRFQRGGPPMPRGRGRGIPPPMQQQQQFNPRMGFSTGHNLNQAGGMRAWSNERPMPSNTVPMRGRGRGGPRGMMRGMRGMRGAPMQMQNRPVRQPPQHFQQQEEEYYPQEEEVYQPVQAPKQPNKKAQMAQQLMVKQEVAQNRLRIATQVLMQRQQQLEEANAAVQAQASLKTRGLRLRGGAVGRVTGIRRGGGVVKRQVDARTAIKQKIVRASVNRQRALQQAQNMPMRVNVPNTRMQMQMQQQQQMQPQQMPHPHMAPRGRPMAARGMAAAAIRRNAVRRAQMTQGAKQLMRNAKQLTLHERFSHQGY